MSRIVAGRFDRSVDADAALGALRRDGFSRAEVDTFYVGPPGQNARLPLGGDIDADAGARHAGVSGLIGAVIGLAVGLVAGFAGGIDLGAATVPLSAGLGALVGVFAGVMTSLHAATPHARHAHIAESRGGRVIAVCVDRQGTEQRAVTALRSNNAREVGRTEGLWRNGWKDFDPGRPLAAV